ncbi:hemagglutinin, partial [Photorhabdus luminescens]
ALGAAAGSDLGFWLSKTPDCDTTCKANIAKGIADGNLIVSAGGMAVAGGAQIVAATPEIAAMARAALEGCKAAPTICLNNAGIQVAEALTPGGVGAAGVIGVGKTAAEATVAKTVANRVKENVTTSQVARESSNFGQYSKTEGSVQESLGIWPPNRGAYGPVEKVTLPTGKIIDRYGHPGGNFVSPAGVPFSERALPPSYETTKPYFQYKIIKPIPDVPKSNILPWFGQKGTGTQYELPKPVQWYLDNEYMKKVDK